ncbi:hypothetical protein JYU34_012835 [Plutella xylostella]|uniref:Uncharacterized protein n=1 Tax=Plutella xylostella TaxID=51655 RepID=A0ABQ7QDL7_PLUXY|nr:hypothetical protein JYU34_012835 [Plutella xylostella]
MASTLLGCERNGVLIYTKTATSPKPQHLVLRAGYLLEPAPWTVKTHSWKIGFNTQQQAASRIIW